MVVSKYGVMKVILPGLDIPLQIMVCVVEDKCHTDDVPVLIGTNAMDDWKIGLRKRYADDGRIPAVNWVIDNWKPSGPSVACVRLDAPETIEPEEIAVVTVVAENNEIRRHDRDVVFVSQRKFDDSKGFQMASRIVKIPSDHHSVKIEAVVCNHGRNTRTLPAGQRIGVLEAIESVMIPEYHRNESDNIKDEKLLRMFDGEEFLSPNDYQKFKDLILKNRAVFELTSNDLGCAKDVEHMIQLDDEVPVKERYQKHHLHWLIQYARR